jgi:signal peptidase I
MKINDKYKSPWIGVLLSILLCGSAQFLSGKRGIGLAWFFGLLACVLVGDALLITPGTAPYVLGVLIILLSVILGLVMLKQSYHPVPRLGVFGWIVFLALVVLLNGIEDFLVKQVIEPFKMSSRSMQPTLFGIHGHDMAADRVLVERLSYRFSNPKRGDLVVFSTEGIEMLPKKVCWVYRIVGLPGERIRIEPPFLIVNNQKVTDPPIFSMISSETAGYVGFQLPPSYIYMGDHSARVSILSKPTDEITLGEGEYFVLGDNSSNSFDGRYWGPLPKKNIIGKVARIFWPLNRINILD